MSEYQAVKDGIENSFCNVAYLAVEAIGILRNTYDRPSAVYRPTLSMDGNTWIAVYDDNLQTGCVGTGKSPDAAMWDYDRAWYKES